MVSKGRMRGVENVGLRVTKRPWAGSFLGTLVEVDAYISDSRRDRESSEYTVVLW